jgi:transglutaminase-like putative cysteine protease
MGRTVLLYLLPAFLVATHWARLEDTSGSQGRFLWIAALALAPALVRPLWGRALALAVAGAIAIRIAFDTSILDARPFSGEDFFGPFASKLWRGFEAFFDVALPFRPADRPEMHGAILLAVFGFCVVLALAIAARRPLLASAVLIAGAGWPATIFVGKAELERGALILAAALLLFAGMRSLPTRDLRQPLVAGAAVVVAAVAFSTSPSVARGEFVDGWRTWDVNTGNGPSVDVRYVWNANYSGIKFPKEPTTVLSIEADEQAGVYWRATTLDLFDKGHWREQLYAAGDPELRDGVEDLSSDPFLPRAARNRNTWLEAKVHVEALHDNHFVGAGVPVAYDTGDKNAQYYLGNVAMTHEGTTRGDSYTVWSYAPKPTPQQLGKSKPRYPDYLTSLYLTIEGSPLPRYGSPDHDEELQAAFRRNPRLRAYEGLYTQARDLVGTPANPYAAVVALESWFRSGGDFVYDERPPRPRGTPALVSFVSSTRRGYCQHFAGAMAVMLRTLGIPARVAAGFTSGRYDGNSERWTVADRNAHTWVEAWFKGYGWLPFDPTPGRGQLGGTYTTSSLRFDLASFRRAVGGVAGRASDLLRGETGGPDQSRRATATGAASAAGESGGRNGGIGIVRLVSLLALAAAILLAMVKLVRRAARFLTRDPREVAAACRRDLAGFVADQGLQLPASATNAEVGDLVADRFGVDPDPLVAALTVARFGPPELAVAAAGRARVELRRLRRAMRSRLTLARRARGLLSVRSLTA